MLFWSQPTVSKHGKLHKRIIPIFKKKHLNDVLVTSSSALHIFCFLQHIPFGCFIFDSNTHRSRIAATISLGFHSHWIR